MESKVVVITGSGGGVGKALCDIFKQNGWIVCGLNHLSMDVKSIFEVCGVFDACCSTYGKIDVLINNAAVFKSKLLENCNYEDVDEIVDTNLKGAIFCTMEGIKLMKRGGRVINIGSVAGKHGIASQSLYCASKHGLMGFSDAMSKERKDILFTTVNPGGINTPLWNESNPYNGNVDDLISPIDIAKLVHYISELPDNVVLKEVTLYPTNEEH